jgi:MFS family permease
MTMRPEDADQLLARVSHFDAQVRSEGRAYERFLLLLAGTTATWFVVMAWASATDVGVGISAGVFGIVVAVVSLTTLPRARASRAGFARRFLGAMIGWAMVFAATLTVGLLVARAQVAYWVIAAVVAAAPLVVGAVVERRS